MNFFTDPVHGHRVVFRASQIALVALFRPHDRATAVIEALSRRRDSVMRVESISRCQGGRSAPASRGGPKLSDIAGFP
jgi:hypothetical protein